jgi:peptidoglycan/LPS O-acetylase OafA/YrhL
MSIKNPQFHFQTPSWVYVVFLQNYSFHNANMDLVWFGVTWSLGVEEQFYLLAPPLIRNAQPRQLCRILLAVLAFAFVLRLFLVTIFGLGRVSYCVYLIHVAVDWMVHEYVRGDLPRFDSPRSIAVTVLAFSVTLLIAELSWSLFEHPLVRRGHRYSH